MSGRVHSVCWVAMPAACKLCQRHWTIHRVCVFPLWVGIIVDTRSFVVYMRTPNDVRETVPRRCCASRGWVTSRVVPTAWHWIDVGRRYAYTPVGCTHIHTQGSTCECNKAHHGQPLFDSCSITYHRTTNTSGPDPSTPSNLSTETLPPAAMSAWPYRLTLGKGDR